MTLRDLISSDASTVFCNVDDFAEAVTYYPRGGGSRSINAVVVREPVEQYPQDEVTALAVYEVHITNDDVLGISSVELDTGGDAIAFPPRDGKDAVKKQITRILSQDHGMMVLECR